MLGRRVTRLVAGRRAEVQDEAFDAHARLGPHVDFLVTLELGYLGFDQVPDDIDLAGLELGNPDLSTGRDPEYHLVNVGLALDVVIRVLGNRDVIAGRPFHKLVGAGADRFPVEVGFVNRGLALECVRWQDCAKE